MMGMASEDGELMLSFCLRSGRIDGKGNLLCHVLPTQIRGSRGLSSTRAIKTARITLRTHIRYSYFSVCAHCEIISIYGILSIHARH